MSSTNQPTREPGRPAIRPISRKASRGFVVACVLFAVASGVGMGYYFVETASSPEVRERIQRLEAERDSVGRATEAVPPDVLQDSLDAL